MKNLLLKPDMLEAFKRGDKTQTRRLLIPQPIASVYEIKEHSELAGYWIPYAIDRRMVNNNVGNRKDDCGYYPRFHVGEVVFLGEPHYRYGHWRNTGTWTKAGRKEWEFVPLTDEVRYKENCPSGVCRPELRLSGWYKRTPLFMPAKDARTHARITSIGCGRLWDMTEADCKAEGIEGKVIYGKLRYLVLFDEPVSAFAFLWDKINPRYPWSSNPWVFNYGIERVEL